MHRFLILYGLIFTATLISAKAQVYKPEQNTAFTEGESLKYRVYYQSKVTGKLTAGIGHLEVHPADTLFDNRSVYHIKGYGRTKGVINWFIKVREHFESFIDKEALVPHFFYRDTREGNYYKEDKVRFDFHDLKARSWYDTTSITEQTQDILSAFYYARNFDFDSITKGDRFHVDYFLDDSLYISAIEFIGYEIIETDYGTFRCLGFKPKVSVGQVFKEPYPGVLWVTDDKNRLPLLAETEVFVGSVKLELIDAEGIRNPEKARFFDKKKTFDKEPER
ncbi:MAG: DUF3108 domain-containing protein [Bacteroidota bacterium]